jgi:hypothetical protein
MKGTTARAAAIFFQPAFVASNAVAVEADANVSKAVRTVFFVAIFRKKRNLGAPSFRQRVVSSKAKKGVNIPSI